MRGVAPDDRRPKRLWYWVGGGIVGLGIAAAVGWALVGVLAFVHRIDGFQRAPLGAERRIVFSQAGDYTLYYEGPGADDESNAIPNFDVTLVPVEGDQSVRLSEYGSKVTYSIGGHRGRAVASFHLDKPGTYLLGTVSRSDGTGQVAVGRGLGRKIVKTVVGSLVLGFVGLATGAAIVIVTAVKRHSRRPRAPAPPAAPAGSSSWGHPPPAWTPPPPWAPPPAWTPPPPPPPPPPPSAG